MNEYIIKVDEEEEDGSQKVLECTDLVRCKDCVYLGNPKKCIIQNYVEKKDILWLLSLQSDWFCADGKRSE